MHPPTAPRSRKTLAWIGAGFIVAVAITALLAWAYVFPPSWALRSDWFEHNRAALSSGLLTPDLDGRVALPDPIPGAMGYQVNKAFIGASASGTRAMYFPYWRGKGNNTEGFIYAPGVPVGATIRVVAPNATPGVVPPTTPTILHLIVEETIDSNWRRAAFRED